MSKFYSTLEGIRREMRSKGVSEIEISSYSDEQLDEINMYWAHSTGVALREEKIPVVDLDAEDEDATIFLHEEDYRRLIEEEEEEGVLLIPRLERQNRTSSENDSEEEEA